jgi:hypothetical protein
VTMPHFELMHRLIGACRIARVTFLELFLTDDFYNVVGIASANDSQICIMWMLIHRYDNV